MARLIYSALCSLDGYFEDTEGEFGWAVPPSDVAEVVNAREAEVGTMLLGRRMYDTLVAWETVDREGGFADVWRGCDKVVYSRTLAEPRSARTRIEPEFEPDAVRALKADSARDLSIGGGDIAAAACRAGLVDAIDLYVFPVAVGAGKPVLPRDHRLDLELTDSHRFATGVVNLRYRIAD